MSPTVPRMPAPRPAQAPRVPMMPAPSPIQSAQQPLSSGGMASMNGMPMLPGYQAPGMQMPPGNSVMLNSDDLAVQGQVIADQMDTIVTGMQQVALFTGQIETAWKSLLAQTKAVQQEADSASSPEGMAAPVPSGAENAKENRVKAGDHRAEPSRFTRLAEMAGAADLGAKEAHREDSKREQQPAPEPGHPAGPRVAGRRRDGSRTTRPPEGGTDPEHDPDKPPPIRPPHLGADLGELRQYGAQHAVRALQNMAGHVDPAVHPRTANLLTRAMGFAGTVGEDGMMAGLGAALPELVGIAGPVGAVLSAGSLANKFVLDQRANNAAYQNIYGGTNFSQLGQRAQEFSFAHFGTLGVLGSDEATRLFQNVSATGIQGNDRQRALDFALNNYRTSGMSTDLSSRLIEQSVENGVTNFSALSEALDKVSAAAVQTGQSVGKAQEQFVSMFHAVSQVTSNVAGGDIAGGLSAWKTSLGKGMASLDATSAVSDLQQQRMSASLLGMDTETFIARSQTDPHMISQAMNARMSELAKYVVNQGQMQSQGVNDLIAEMKRSNGGKALNDDQLAEIGRKMMTTGAGNLEELLQIAPQFGLNNVTEADGTTWLGRLGTMQGMDTSQSFAPPVKNTKAADSVTSLLGGNGGTGSLIDNSLLGYGADGSPNKSINNAISAFSSQNHDGKKVGRIENLLSSSAKGTDGMYLVRDKNGRSVAVTLAEAVRSYSDQLESGSAVFNDGPNKGKSVGSVVSDSYSGPAKAAAASASKVQGQITVSAKGALQNFIDMQASGNLSLTGSKRNGVPATPYALTPNDYTSATP